MRQGLVKKKKTVIGVSLALLLVGIYIGIQYYVDRSATNAVNRELEKISAFAEIRYEDLNIDLFKKRLRLENIRLSPKSFDDKIIIDELTLHQPGTASETAENIQVQIKGIRIDPAHPGGFLKPVLRDVGYEDIRLDLECSGSYDPEKQILEITHLKAGAQQVAEATLRLRLENINLNQIKNLPNNLIILLTMISGVSIASAEFNYRDDSLVNHIYKSQARRKGQTVEAYVQTLTGRIKDMIRDETDPRTRHIFKSLHDFLLAPDTLNIRIKPKRPVSVFSLYWAREPSKLLKILGVAVST
jgi:hypothetical protein